MQWYLNLSLSIPVPFLSERPQKIYRGARFPSYHLLSFCMGRSKHKTSVSNSKNLKLCGKDRYWDQTWRQNWPCFRNSGMAQDRRDGWHTRRDQDVQGAVFRYGIPCCERNVHNPKCRILAIYPCDRLRQTACTSLQTRKHEKILPLPSGTKME